MGILDLFRRWQENHSSKHRVRRRPQVVCAEVLEVRQVLSAVGFAGGVLTIAPATAQPITVTNGATGVTVNVDGSAFSSPYAGVTTINLNGNASNNAITLNGSFAGIKFTIAGGGGTDTLTDNYTSNTWNITGSNSGNLNEISATNGIFFSGISKLVGGSGTDTFSISGGSISSITGGGGNETLSDTAVTNTFNVTGANTGTVNTTTFTGINNLTGGNGTNTFAIYNGGSISGNVTGGLGTSTLDYTHLPANTAVTVNLATGAATDVGHIQSISNINGTTSSSNVLIGANGSNAWTISSLNSGKVADTPLALPITSTVTFNNFANLTGGTGPNTFSIMTGGSLSGAINGGTTASGQIPTNWLDYSQDNASVTVNLGTNTATGIAGGVTNINGVHGGQLASTLVGNSAGVALVGAGNGNTVTAGSGASLLIGGGGSDILTGGASPCIIIAGYTSFDTNFAALSAILAEWKSSDSFNTKVSDLRYGGGLNGTNLLVANSTVHNDFANNSVSDGTGGPNWLWARPNELTYSRSNDLVDSPILAAGSLVVSGTLSAIYIPGKSPVSVGSAITISDGVLGTLASATIQISGNFNSGDLLTFTSSSATGNIKGSYNATTGTMTLTSQGNIATIKQFETALSQVTFSTTSATSATPGTRTLSFQVSDGYQTSNLFNTNTTVAVSYPPVLTGTTTQTFTTGSPAVTVNPTVTLTDANTTVLPLTAVATIRLTWPLNTVPTTSEDVIAFSGNANTGSIKLTKSPTTNGVWMLQASGNVPATVAQFQAALRLITYVDSLTVAQQPFTLPRTISFTFSNGTTTSNTVSNTINYQY